MFCKLNLAKSLEFADIIQSIKSIKKDATNVSQNQNNVNIAQIINNL